MDVQYWFWWGFVKSGWSARSVGVDGGLWILLLNGLYGRQGIGGLEVLFDVLTQEVK